MYRQGSISSQAWLSLVAVLLLAAVMRLAFMPGMLGSDDLSIASIALRIMDGGVFLPTMHYETRLALTLPLAGIFKVFGVGVGPLVAYPLAASLAGVALAFLLGARLFEPAVGLMAAVSLALYPLDIEYAGLMFPDLIQGMWLAAAVVLAIAASDRGSPWLAILAGLCWAVGYFVKLDAFFLCFVLGMAWLLGFVTFRTLLLVGVVTGTLVGAELATYWWMTGNPLLNATLARIAANEMLAAGHDYRDPLTYPRAMFLAPQRSALHFYAVLGGIAVSLSRRRAADWLLLFWVGLFMVWLAFGVDPMTLQLRPQLSRYLMIISVPVMVLAGRAWVWAWRRSTRRPIARAAVVLAALAAFGIAVPIAFYNASNYVEIQATRNAVARAVAEGMLPLGMDVGSQPIGQFLLHGSPAEKQLLVVQTHNFLTGQTGFPPIAVPRAYLLINTVLAERQQVRNLVKPIDPAGYGMKVTEVAQVGAPLPAATVAMLRVLRGAVAVVPVPAIRARALKGLDNMIDPPAMVRIYRLDR